MSYDGLLLDHDGVLVRIFEDEGRLPTFREQLVEAFRSDGLEPPTEEVISALSHGISYDEVMRFSEELGVPADQLWRYRDDTFAAILTDAARTGKKRPYDDIRALDDIDLPLGIASNNQRRVVEFIVNQYDLADRFGTIHAREPQLGSLQEKKPQPTYLERGMGDLDVTNPLYVGDKETDILAGQRAGLDTVFLRRAHNAGVELGRQPTYEVDGLDAVASILERE